MPRAKGAGHWLALVLHQPPCAFLCVGVDVFVCLGWVGPLVSCRAVLNAKKKKSVQNGVISKEPADSTCLHPGVPNCSTMSP